MPRTQPASLSVPLARRDEIYAFKSPQYARLVLEVESRQRVGGVSKIPQDFEFMAGIFKVGTLIVQKLKMNDTMIESRPDFVRGAWCGSGPMQVVAQAAVRLCCGA